MIRDQLLKVSPVMGVQLAAIYGDALEDAMRHFSIVGRANQAGFIAQAMHESGSFRRMVENLNYNVAGLLATFPTHITPEQAQKYGRIDPNQRANQRQIAILAYGDRMGNRPGTEDGWTYRGRGLFQLTGRANYAACGAALGLDLLANPEMLEGPAIACMSAAWFWVTGNPTGRDLGMLAAMGDVLGVTKGVNGGKNGLAERIQLTDRLLKALA